MQKRQEPLKLLIDRNGNMKKAKNERSAKAFHMMMDMDKDIPIEVMPFCTDGVEAAFYRYYALKDREAHEQLSPRSRGLAVWADAELITDKIKEQLPTSTHMVEALCSTADSPLNLSWVRCFARVVWLYPLLTLLAQRIHRLCASLHQSCIVAQPHAAYFDMLVAWH